MEVAQGSPRHGEARSLPMGCPLLPRKHAGRPPGRRGEGSKDCSRQPRTAQHAYRVAWHRQAGEVAHTAVILCIFIPPTPILPAPVLFTLTTVAGAGAP